MRWISCFILAYVLLGLQSGLGAFIRYRDAAPNLMLLGVIFIAIHAPREPALLGCFLMGLMQDMLSREPPGLYAFSYGLVAWFVVAIQRGVYRNHPLTHFSLALGGGLLTALMLSLQGWLAGSDVSPMLQFTVALYTAVLAPAVLWVLLRCKRLFAFEPSRRKVRSW